MKKTAAPDPPGFRAPSAVPNRAPSVVSDDHRSSTSGSSFTTINSQKSDDPNDKDYVPPNTEEEQDEDDEEEGEDEETPAAAGLGLISSGINYIFRGGKGKGRGKSSTSTKSSAATKESGQSTSTAGTENNEEEHDHMVVNGVEYPCDPFVIKLFKEQMRQLEMKKPKRLTRKRQTRQTTRPQITAQNSTRRLSPCRCACYCRRRKNKDSPIAGLTDGDEPNWITKVQLFREKNPLDAYIRKAPLAKDKDAFLHTMRNLGYLRNTKSCSITPEDFNGGSYLRVWDLGTSGDCNMSEMAATVVAGTYDLTVKFAKLTTESYSIIVLTEKPAVITIESSGMTSTTLYN